MAPEIQVAPAPENLKNAAHTLFSSSAKNFLAKALERWEPEVIQDNRVVFIYMPPSWQVEAMLRERRRKKLDFDKYLCLPGFPSSHPRNDQSWKVMVLKRVLLPKGLTRAEMREPGT